MKSKIIVLLICFGLCLSFHLNGKATKNKTLLVLSVDFMTRTSSRVYCDEFAVSFRDLLSKRVILSKDTISILQHFLHSVKYSKEDHNMDVRAKFIYSSDNDKKVTICVDNFNIKVNDALIEKNKAFLDFLKMLAKK